MSREQRILIWLVVVIAAGFALHLLNDVLLPFVVGMAIAYFFDPLADRLEGLGLSRAIATSFILLGFFVATFGVAALLVPLLQDQLVALARLLPQVVDRLQVILAPILEQLRADLTADAMEQIKAAVGNYAGTAVSWMTGFLGQVWSGGLALLNVLSLVLITPLVAFYLLRDWDNIVEKVDHWLPRDAADTIREQARRIDTTLAGFVRGQALVCLSLAILYAVGLSAVGLNAGVLIGIAAGLLAVVPYIGAAVSMIVGVGLAVAQFHQDWVSILMVAFVFFVGQTLESYVLTPRLVGGRVGLSPVWIIFAMLAGGSLFGLTGVLIALPVAAVVGVLVRFAIEQYLDSALYRGHGNDAPTDTK
jgi:predicted PurR-regulated permease PerM